MAMQSPERKLSATRPEVRVVSPDSPYSPLQQRLLYMERHPHRAWTNIIENVPQWPAAPQLPLTARWDELTAYAPCQGASPLVDALVDRERTRFGLDVGAENVLVTNGGLHGLSLIFRHLQGQGGLALCQAPVLAAIPAMLRACGYRVEFFAAPEGDTDAIARAATADLRLIYVNTPHNPSGAILGAATIDRLVEIAESRGAAVVADLVYDAFVFGDRDVCNPLARRRAWSSLYAVNSISKSYGAPGLRVGWITTAAGNVRALAGALEREVIAVSGMAQAHARALLEHGNAALVAAVHEGKRFVESRLASNPSVRVSVPAGGSQLAAELPVGDVEHFCDFMLAEHGVGLVSSSNYEGAARPFVRIPFGCDRETLGRALGLLAGELEQAGATRDVQPRSRWSDA
jgi:aspartate aminotransferase